VRQQLAVFERSGSGGREYDDENAKPKRAAKLVSNIDESGRGACVFVGHSDSNPVCSENLIRR
jgi:hypothetical protein